jgi:hypothetical protein
MNKGGVIMKRVTSQFIITIILIGFSAGLAGAVPINMSDSGMEVIGPSKIILHNVSAASGFYSVTFQWNAGANIWSPTSYKAEFPSFDAQKYFPLTQGSAWTYTSSAGGTLTVTINGTETVCGVPTVRMEASDGSRICWISDDSGIYMAKYDFPEGYYNSWCPPMKVSPGQNYLGTNILVPFYDAEIGTAFGVFATMDGWAQFALKGIEDVTVPAGTFRNCFRATLIFSFTVSDGSFGVRTEEAWYARGVGFVKRLNATTSSFGGAISENSAELFELQSYYINP